MDVSEAYQVLGVPVGASRKEATEAKRDLLQLLHPDRHANSDERLQRKAAQKTRDINDAFETLQRAQFPTTKRELPGPLGHDRPTTQQEATNVRFPCPTCGSPLQDPSATCAVCEYQLTAAQGSSNLNQIVKGIIGFAIVLFIIVGIQFCVR
jgi:DnaJ domain